MGNLILDVRARVEFRSDGLLDCVNDDFLKEGDTAINAINYARLFNLRSLNYNIVSFVKLVYTYYPFILLKFNKFNDLVTGVGHNIESGKDFTVDGLSGFSKKKKKKRRHRWVSHPNFGREYFLVIICVASNFSPFFVTLLSPLILSGALCKNFDWNATWNQRDRNTCE